MKSEFALQILDEKIGNVTLSWDELCVTLHASARWRGEGICKLFAVGEGGRCILGTLVPENGRLVLERTLPLSQLRRAGAWPVSGVAVSLLYPWDHTHPFPLPALFCFAQRWGEQLWFHFFPDGAPRMPE